MKSCDNCGNNVRPTIGKLFPTDECLEHNPELGVDTSKEWKENGKSCTHWIKKMKISRN